MRISTLQIVRGWTFLLWLALGLTVNSTAWAGSQPGPAMTIITNALQLRRLTSHREVINCQVCMEGIVLWDNQEHDQIIIQDGTGGVAIRLDACNQPRLEPGQRVVFNAWCLVGANEVFCCDFIRNDAVHGAREQSATRFFPQGLIPLRVEWFNRSSLAILDIQWKGPRFSRQSLSTNALFRDDREPPSTTNKFSEGLDYRCYEGQWARLPDFTTLQALKVGISSNFDTGVSTRNEDAGIIFDGYLAIPIEGNYTFWLKSDDGSRLSLGGAPLQFKSQETLPKPRQLIAGQAIPEEADLEWAEVEGLVTFVNEIPGGAFVELSSPLGRSRLNLTDSNSRPLSHLKGCRIKAMGICQRGFSTEGQPGFSLMVPKLNLLSILEQAPSNWGDYPILSISSLVHGPRSATRDIMVHAAGLVCSNGPGQFMVIEDKTGRISVRTPQPLPPEGEAVEVLGLWGTNHPGTLEDGFYQKTTQNLNSLSNQLPLLTQAVQVKRLSRSEAQRGYPVKICGTITAQLTGRAILLNGAVRSGFTIQDSTWSLYFLLSKPGEGQKEPKVGEYWEIEGVTEMRFAPSILVQSSRYLRKAIPPEVLRPTWDELINGSLDTQCVEIQGYVTEVTSSNSLVLLTPEGKLDVQFPEFFPQNLKSYERELIRLRGVCSPERDASQQMVPAHLRFFNPSISVDKLPAVPFESPLEHVSDLLSFDVRANALHQLRIAGQIIHQSNGEYFLMDGADGLRFRPKAPLNLQVGDLVEIEGFPSRNGPSPFLREALVRQTGQAALPAPRRLSESVLNSKLDSTLVCIEALVISSRSTPTELVLDLQTGNSGFVGRLQNKKGPLPKILTGSLLELTGTYAGQGGDLAAGQAINSFELLLNSPSDIRVLSMPTWWTTRHALTVVGCMVLVILAALIWITFLRRQVQERTVRLEAEIQSRQYVEHQRALQEERTRIARDLHDDLGASLTQIRFLSTVTSNDSLLSEFTRTQLKQVSERARQTVVCLDEIVWAINPANDTLNSLAAYLRHVAEEFFATTAVSCRLDIDKSLPTVPLTSEVRHNIYLSVREALNNSAKHAHATELWLRIHFEDQTLKIAVEDNGCGFQGPDALAGQDGLSNMRGRLEKIGGIFECETRPGSGTVCRMSLHFA